MQQRKFILLICFIAKLLLTYMTDQTSSLECGKNKYFKHTCKDCIKCPAGYREKIPCGKYKNTVCRKCPVGKFSEDGDKSCHKCTRCLPGQFAVEPCSGSSDTLCECYAGSYFSRIARKCKTCQNCPVGFYQKRNCDKRKNTICRPCRNGYYSDTENADTCKKCTDCPAGQFISKPCTSKTDTVCSVCPEGTYSDTNNTLYYCKSCKRCDVGRHILRHCSATDNTLCGNCSTDFFQLQLRNSSQCVRCSECNGKDGGVLTIVEECRIKSNDPRKICVPEIIQRHSDLNKTALAAYMDDNYSTEGTEVIISRNYKADNGDVSTVIITLLVALIVFIILVVTFVIKQWILKPKHKKQEQKHLIESPPEIQSNGYTANWCVVNIFNSLLRVHSSPNVTSCSEKEGTLRHAKSTPLNNDNMEENISFFSPGSVASSSLFSISRVVSVKSLEKDYKHTYTGT